MDVMEGTIVLPGEETEERGNTLGVELIEIKKVDKFNLLVR